MLGTGTIQLSHDENPVLCEENKGGKATPTHGKGILPRLHQLGFDGSTATSPSTARPMSAAKGHHGKDQAAQAISAEQVLASVPPRTKKSKGAKGLVAGRSTRNGPKTL